MTDKDEEQTNTVLVFEGGGFLVQGHKPDKLSRLCACCEQLGEWGPALCYSLLRCTLL